MGILLMAQLHHYQSIHCPRHGKTHRLANLSVPKTAIKSGRTNFDLTCPIELGCRHIIKAIGDLTWHMQMTHQIQRAGIQSSTR